MEKMRVNNKIIVHNKLMNNSLVTKGCQKGSY